jgi:hypothetical protein
MQLFPYLPINVQNSLDKEYNKDISEMKILLPMWYVFTCPHPLSRMKLSYFTKQKPKFPVKFWGKPLLQISGSPLPTGYTPSHMRN